MTAQLTNTNAAAFIFGGKARFTLKSRKTGAHISLRVKKAKDGDCYFVYARKGEGYSYMGWMKSGDTAVRVSKKSNPAATGAPRTALEWSLKKLSEGSVPDQLEIWHEGCCCRCGRKLTDPVSIQRGIGPECFGKMTGSKVVS